MAKIQCPKCGARTELSEDPTTERAKCTFCGHTFEVTELVPPVPVRVPVNSPWEERRSNPAFMVTAAIAGIVVILGGVLFLLRSPAPPPNQPVPTPSEPTQTPSPAPTKSAPIDAGPPPLADVVLEFGGKGTGPGQMDRPKWIAVAPDGTIWTADLPSRIQAFDAKGTWLRTFQPTTTNQGDGPLEDDIVYVTGLAVDHAERVWITLGYEVLALSAKDGAVVKKIPMKRPTQCFMHLTMDAADTLFATSNCPKQDVHGIFAIDTKTATIKHRFAEPNNFEKATDWKIGVDAKGNLYCPHSEERKAVVLDREWKLVRTFGVGETGFVGNIAVDGAGRVLVNAFDGIEVFDDQLRPLGRVNTPDHREVDLAIGPEGDLYVLTGEGKVVRMKWRAQ